MTLSCLPPDPLQPIQSVNWLKDGFPIETDDQKIYVARITMSDGGLYFCNGKTADQSYLHTYCVTVQGKSDQCIN